MPTLRFSFSIMCELQPLRLLLHQEQHSAFPHQSLRNCGVRYEERRNASGRAESIPFHSGTRGGNCIIRRRWPSDLTTPAADRRNCASWCLRSVRAVSSSVKLSQLVAPATPALFRLWFRLRLRLRLRTPICDSAPAGSASTSARPLAAHEGVPSIADAGT